MKIKVLNRNEAECTRERRCDLQRVHRNPDPVLHPFEKAREYTRALNAVKLDQVFAKPFLSAMDGHSDGVYCMGKNPKRLNVMASGACDGEIRVWQLSSGKCLLNMEEAHGGFVRGLAWSSDGARLLSCGDDKTVKLWCPRDTVFTGSCAAADIADEVEADAAEAAAQAAAGNAVEWDGMRSNGKGKGGLEPTLTFTGKRAFLSIDNTWDKSGNFCTGGGSLDVWDTHRSQPLHTWNWGVDSINAVRYNPAQPNIIGSCASDRSIALYDVRLGTPIRKLVLQMKSNALAWNPMEAFNFTVPYSDHQATSKHSRHRAKLTVLLPLFCYASCNCMHA